MENAFIPAVAEAHLLANVAAVGALLTQVARGNSCLNERTYRGQDSRRVLPKAQHQA